MRKFKSFLLLSIFFICFEVKAQDTIVNPMQIDILSVGLGVGLDYGGFGGNLLYYPNKNIGLFVGAGYAMVGLGYNAGVKFRLISDQKFSRFNVYLQAMYGYNAAIAVQDATDLSKLFYGPSFGLGFDYRMRPISKGYWSVAILLPIRSSDVDDYIDDLKTNHGVEFENDLFPVGFSFGYRFIIQARTTNLQMIKSEN